MNFQPSDFKPKGRIKEIKGNIAAPESAGNRFIFVMVDSNGETKEDAALKRWPAALAEYSRWYRNSYGNMEKHLGTVKTVQVQSDTCIVLLLCMKDSEIDSEALKKAIDKAGYETAYNSGFVHMPKFGDWEEVSKLVDAFLLKRGLNVNVYVG